jgi:predicted GTPase
MKRILLDQEDFEKLTKGEIVRKDDVEIALSDIGYYNMIEIIISNMDESEDDL